MSYSYSGSGGVIGNYSEEDEVKWWFGRTDLSRAIRKRWFKKYAWPSLEWLMGKNQEGYDNEDVTIMLIQADTQTAISAISIKDLQYTLAATQPLPALVDRGELVDLTGRPILTLPERQLLGENLIRHFLNDSDGIYNVQDTLESVRWDSFWSYGVADVEASGTWVPTKAPKGEHLKTEHGVLLFDPKTNEPILSRGTKLVNQHYRFRHIPSEKFLIDSRSRANMAGAEWNAEEGETVFEDMKASGMYNMKGVRPSRKHDENDMDDDNPLANEFEELRTGMGKYAGSFADQAGFETDDPRNKTLRWIYINDMREKRYKMIGLSNNKTFLLNEPWPIGVEGSKYSVLSYATPYSNRFWPMPPIYPLIAPAKEYDACSQFMRIAREGAIEKFLITRGELPPDQIDRIIGPVHRQIVYTPKAAREFEEKHFRRLKATESGQIEAVVQSAAKSLSDLGRVGAAPAEARGEQSADTATQSTYIQNQNAGRNNWRRDRYVQFLGKMGLNMWKLIQGTLTIPVAVRILGQALGQFWYQLSDPSEIEGEFDVGVRVEAIEQRYIREGATRKIVEGGMAAEASGTTTIEGQGGTGMTSEAGSAAQATQQAVGAGVA